MKRALALLVLLPALAVEAKPPPMIPEALLDACAKKPRGAPCTVKLGGATKSGVCTPLADETLACMQQRAAKKPPLKPKPAD